MTSAGSFVHGGNGSVGGTRSQSNEEQDINDFLSSIDEMTSAAPAGTSVNLRGRSSPGAGDVFLSSSSPPARQQAMGGSAAGELVLGPDEGSAIADAFPEDWLNGMEGMEIGAGVDSSASQEPQSSPARNGEILGEEPEILDDLDGGYDSGTAAAGMLMSAGGRMASWAASTPASLVGAATAAFRGDTPRAAESSAKDGPMQSSSAAPGPSAADEPPLDWPGTLDMLGMAETESGGDSAAGEAPASELPSMAPPAARKESFPDFVEIRDPRNVSQFPKPDNAFVYLRPDVTWESVSDVYMAVMLSRGLVVRQQTEKMVTAEKSADAPGDWATVKLTVGVTRDKLRTLVIQFYSDTRGPMLSFAGTMARFTGRAGDGLFTALRDALVERRMPLSFLATDAEEVSLDPHYVRDLVGMYAHENVVNLTRYALPLEEFVREEEERSARLEATLLPQYRANGLTPPRPTRSKPLSAYPLTTRRPPVSSCGVEEARQVMERAREYIAAGGGGKANGAHPRKDIDSERDGTSKKIGGDDDSAFAGGGDGGDGRRSAGIGEGSGSAPSSVPDGIRSLIRATWEDVKDWCDEEAEARVRRKDAQVRDRLRAVERHRESLVAVLRDGAGGSAAGGTPVGQEFAARFRPMAGEAVLCQCKAVHAKRVGQLYLTCNHVCFHSSVLGFTSQRVLPLLTVLTVAHTPSVLGMELVTLVDRGGEDHSFGITSVEAGFPQRFCDLLKQCLVLCKADASRRAAQREGVNASQREPDEEQILARVQRLAKAKQLREAREAAAAAAAAAATAAAEADDRPAATSTARAASEQAVSSSSGAENVQGTGRDEGGVAARGEGEGKDASRAAGDRGEPADAGSEESRGGQEEGVGRGGGGGGSGGGRSGSMMAMGIQAFLQESQRRQMKDET
ncbi:unnamed protein product [Scytosiphon promiscuus]